MNEAYLPPAARPQPDARPAVVCVDDEPLVLSALKRMLRSEPYDVVTFEKPDEALSWLREHPAALIVTDQRMPGMKGTELIRAVLEFSPCTIFIVLVGSPDTAVICDRANLRIRRLITKPWEERNLKETIAELLRGGADETPPSDPRPEERVECEGASASEVVESVAAICGRAPSFGSGPTIVLERLSLLGDSVSRLLKDLSRLVGTSAAEIHLRDESGYALAFIEILEGPLDAKIPGLVWPSA